MKNNCITKKLFKFSRNVIATVLLIAVTCSANFAGAASISDLQRQKAAAAAAKAAAAAAAAAKAAEAAQIKQEIYNLNSQISSIQAQINRTTDEINSTQATIDDLKIKIQQTEDELAVEQDKMNKILVAWYMEGDSSGLFNALIKADTLSEVITQEEYYNSVKQQISETQDKIIAYKSDLSKQKNDQDGRIAQLNDLKSGQQSQQAALQSKKYYQNMLLNNATGALASYQAEEKKASDEVARLTKAIQDAYVSYGGGASGAKTVIHRSNGGPQLNVPYYSQRDSRWVGQSLGSSGYTIGDYGCLITSFAMVSSYYGNTKTPADVENQSSFNSEGYFMYFNQSMGELDRYESRYGSVNYNLIDRELSEGKPVIVGVYIGSGFTHWIVLTGGDQNNGYSWNDPYPWINPPEYTSFFAMRIYD